MSETFSEWSFHQCVTLGHRIDGIKDESGENVAWVNTTTKERFELSDDRECEWTKIRIYEGEEVYGTRCSPDSSYVGIAITPHCPNCGGKIKEIKDSICPWCNGTGDDFDENGMMRCMECKGTGKTLEVSND